MWLKGPGLHRSHVVDLFGRLAFVFTLTGARKRSDHPTHREGVNLFGEDFRGATWAVFEASGVATGEQPSFCFVSVVEQGFSGCHLEKFGVERASIEGQLIGLQGWNFG